MQSSNQPAKFLVPFAATDTARVEIPVTTTDDSRASQTLGFPPRTGMPLEVGGVPPQREDFNGAVNQIARGVWWALGGGRFGFDADWATDANIGGYARGAVLPAALGAGVVGMGEWYNNVEANTANPDTVGTGWVPGYHYGETILTGLTGGTLTLTPAQAAKRVLRLSGTLTSNLTIIVPAWMYQWDVFNSTGGAFTVTVKTAGAAGATIVAGGVPVSIRCDGTSVSTYSALVPVFNIAGILPIEKGGTNAGTAVDARTNLGLGTVATESVVPISKGGTGANSAVAARTNLGLGAVDNTADANKPVSTAQQQALDLKLNATGTNTHLGTLTSAGAALGTSEYASSNPHNFSANTGNGDSLRVIALRGPGGGYSWTSASWRLVRQVDVTEVASIEFAEQTSGNAFAFRGAGQNLLLAISNGGACYASGGFQPSSSRELKTAFRPNPYGLAEVLRLETTLGKYRKWFNPDGRERVFHIAENIAEVMPQVAAGDGIEATPPRATAPRKFGGYSIEQMLAVHTKAFQDLHMIVQAQGERIAELEAHIRD